MTERAGRKKKTGKVVSNYMDKTAVVSVEGIKRHSLYPKTIKRTRKYKVHDGKNEVNIGDTVEIMETRPLSKTKRWRLIKIIEKAK